MTEAKGPIFAAGFQAITKGGYPVLLLPDVNNDALQREGKAPVYHWLPNSVRLAQKENGDYKFSFTHFVGVRNEDTHVGTTGTEEAAGALVSFSTTSTPPPGVLDEVKEELKTRFRGSSDHFWGWRSGKEPDLRPAPIVSNTMSITDLAPGADGGVPVLDTPSGVPAGGPTGGTGAPVPPARNRALALRATTQPAARLPLPRTFPSRAATRGSRMDAWYCRLEGEGPGSVTPFAENAFSGLVGSYPAALIYQSFHGGQTGITVWQNLMVKVWSPSMELVIEGEWDRIQDHFSSAARAGNFWFGADIQAEFNNMRQNGLIKVRISIDQSLPGADKLREQMEKRSDMIAQKFLEQANKVIFEPAPFSEKPAEAPSNPFSIFGFSGSAAFKMRTDRTHLKLEYRETQEIGYLQSMPISGQLEGLHDVLKADPTAEKKYFTKIDMGDWDRKVARVVKPVVNWPSPDQEWAGQPVAFLSAQVGYPDANGALQWAAHVFQPGDGANASWRTATAMKAAADVTNPPAGWAPDKTFVKRRVHFGEPPNETENPFVRVSIEKNVVDLDPGESGTPLSDINLEVRVDNVGGINAGPMFLNADLENDKQVIEVTFQAEGKTLDGHDRVPVKFSWRYGDQAQPRYWMVFTGDPAYAPKFKYQVRVLVKGSIFTKGKEWIGRWQDGSGNGPLMISVPTPEDEGVVTRALAPVMIGAGGSPGLPPPQPQGTPTNGANPPLTPPPATGGSASPGAPPPARGAASPPPRTALRSAGWDLTGPPDAPPMRAAADAAPRQAPARAASEGARAAQTGQPRSMGAGEAARSGDTIWETPGLG